MTKAEIITVLFALVVTLTGFAFSTTITAINTEQASQNAAIAELNKANENQDTIIRQLIEDRGVNRANWESVKEQLQRISTKLDGR